MEQKKSDKKDSKRNDKKAGKATKDTKKTDPKDAFCTKPFDQENSRFEDDDNPCKNGEG